MLQKNFIVKTLERTGLFSPEQIEILIKEKFASNQSLTSLVVKMNYATEEDFLKAIAKVMDIEYIDVSYVQITEEVLNTIPTKAVFQFNIIPVKLENNVLVVATSDPLNLELKDTLRVAAGKRIKLAVCPLGKIQESAKSLYGIGADTVDKLIKREDLKNIKDQEQESAKIDLGELDEEASVIKFVNQIIKEAYEQGATDIHFEPMEDRLRIRYRIDGILHETPLPQHLHRFQSAIISRIKVMANMDIAEKRLPLDGRIGLKIHGQDLDIRVSTMPTVYGESVSLRLLQRKGELLNLRQLGLNEYDCKIIENLIHKPNGIILVTGPTGSGKSTSLYAFLQEINSIHVRILTAEEPIEYEMPGINQVLVRPEIGLTFARILRSFLRQDPDIIMIGEIRDYETAEIAIQASLTGHLVLTTLHTNDAAGAFTRLLDMGVEPYLLASAVEASIAQRLVRKLCPGCKKEIEYSAEIIKKMGFPCNNTKSVKLYESSGCEKCRKTGYQGRTGIFEILVVTDSIESLVISKRPTAEIKQEAIRQGMRTLRDDGWDKIIAGITTIEEVLRVSEENI